MAKDVFVGVPNNAAIRELREAVIQRRDSSAHIKVSVRKERTWRAIILIVGALVGALVGWIAGQA